jgi:hypothetical protein
MEEPAPSGAGSFVGPTWAVLATLQESGLWALPLDPRRRAAARRLRGSARGNGSLPSLECQEILDRRLT